MAIERYIRPYEEAKENMLDRARRGTFEYVEYDVVASWRRPKKPGWVPALITWGGIDGYKEERRADAYLERGIAVLAMDGAGVGQAPMKGCEDGERMWDPVIDWLAARDDVDASRIG